MGLPIFAFRNFVDLDGTTLSGGDWNTTLPLANVQDRRLAKVARSVTDATADTQFQIDLGAARTCRIFSLHGHNLSLAATVRLRGYTGVPPTGEIYDSGTITLQDAIYPSGVLEAGHASFSSLDLESEMWGEGYKVDWIIPFTAVSGRYWVCEIDDTANADTYVDIGRVWLSYGYQPTHGLSTGSSLGYETSSRRLETDGGAAFYTPRALRRRWDLALRSFDENEALVYLLELNRHAGMTNQILFCADNNSEDDATILAHMHRKSFIGTLERLNRLQMSRTLWSDQSFTILEEV